MNNKKKIGIYLRFLPVLTLSAVIFYFSSQTGPQSTGQSNVIVDFTVDSFMPQIREMTASDKAEIMGMLTFFIRKLAHFSAYCALGAFSFFALKMVKKLRFRYIFSVAYCVIFSATDEFHQSFVPNRSPEIRDVLIDSAGAIVGTAFAAVIFMVLWYCRNKKKKRNTE